MKRTKEREERWVAVSGGFDPIHVGHIRMMRAAKRFGDKLVVILNNDNWLRRKKGFIFMPQKERVELIRSLPFVDRVVLTDHTAGDRDMSVTRALKKIRPAVFANGGDRGKNTTPESDLCKAMGIEARFGVGRGGKIQSSSWLIQGASRNLARAVRPWGAFYQWDRGGNWNLKTIYIKPKGRLSLQYHDHRSEWWMLVEGEARGIIADAKGTQRATTLRKGEFFKVPLRARHRLESSKGAVVVEISFGKFDENDIVRLEDAYGRKS